MAATLREVTGLLDEMELHYFLDENENGKYIVLPCQTKRYRNSKGDYGVHLVIRLYQSGKVLGIVAPWLYRTEESDDRMMRTCMRLSWNNAYIQMLYDEDDGEVRACQSILLGEDVKLTSSQLYHALGAMIEFVDLIHDEVRAAMGEPLLAGEGQEGVVMLH